MNGGGDNRDAVAAEKEKEEIRKKFWVFLIDKGASFMVTQIAALAVYSMDMDGEELMKNSEKTMTAVAITASVGFFLYFTAMFFRVGYNAFCVCAALGVASQGVLFTFLVTLAIWPNAELHYLPEASVGVAILLYFVARCWDSVAIFFFESCTIVKAAYIWCQGCPGRCVRAMIAYFEYDSSSRYVGSLIGSFGQYIPIYVHDFEETE